MIVAVPYKYCIKFAYAMAKLSYFYISKRFEKSCVETFISKEISLGFLRKAKGLARAVSETKFLDFNYYVNMNEIKDENSRFRLAAMSASM